jgi:hypothetical protein
MPVCEAVNRTESHGAENNRRALMSEGRHDNEPYNPVALERLRKMNYEELAKAPATQGRIREARFILQVKFALATRRFASITTVATVVLTIATIVIAIGTFEALRPG